MSNWHKNDPALQAALVTLAILAGIMAFTAAAIVLVPMGLAYGGWKLYQHYKPLPVYIPPPDPEPESFNFTDTHLREHVAVFAPSGWGKTQFLESYIYMLMTRPNPPALFILDSQDDMLHKLEYLALILERYEDEVYVIDPAETPALNFFDFKGNETELNDVFHYLFSAINRELTGAQATVVSYVMRLMRHIPQPTITTLKDLMESDTPHPAIRQLDETAQDFFLKQFYAKGPMQQTRRAVANRLYTMLANKRLEAMFSAPENKFDAADAMENRAWCFINTSLKHLGEADSALFGRYFIAQILAGCYRLGPTNRLRAVLVLDEAFEYFDEKTERILSQARKYGLGLTFATQNLSQMKDSLRKAVFGNTAVKIAGKVSHDDARALASEMECPPEAIRGLQKTGSHTSFVLAATGTKPFTVSIPFGALDNQPQMSEADHRAFRKMNRDPSDCDSIAQ